MITTDNGYRVPMILDISHVNGYLEIIMKTKSGVLGTARCDSARWCRSTKQFTAHMGGKTVLAVYTEAIFSHSYYEVDCVGNHHYYNRNWNIDEIKAMFKREGRM